MKYLKKTDTHEEILEPSNNINEGSRKVMTRDNLDNDCHDKTCEELAEMCNCNLCPMVSEGCPESFRDLDCDTVTPEDWQKALGEVPDETNAPENDEDEATIDEATIDEATIDEATIDEATIDEDFFKNATPPLKEHPHMVLRCILDEAYEQAAEGKGKERHAGDKPFLRQPIMEIGRMVGEGYNMGQAMKKLQEAETLLRLEGKGVEAAVRELLGAIVYTASAVILLREKYGDKDEASS